MALGRRAVTVRFSRRADGARVALDAHDDAPGAWTIALDVRVRPVWTVTIRSDSPENLHWALSSRAPGLDGREFFAYALRWAGRKLIGAPRGRALRLAVHAGLRPVLVRAAGDLLATVDPALRAVARTFAAPSRTRVAAAVARSRGGWLGQAAAAHPGLVLLGLAMFEAEETEEAGLTLLHGLGEGRRLGPLLDGTLASSSAALPAWSEQPELWDPSARAAFAVYAALGDAARAKVLAAQKVLARRAGPRCDPALLVLPPPIRFAPEDIPTAPIPNGAWFRVMKVPGVTVDAGGEAAPELNQRFSMFASRHAVALARAPRGIPLDAWLRELREVLLAAGRLPSRRTLPLELIAQLDVRELRRLRAAIDPPIVPLVRRDAAGRPVVPLAAEPVAAPAAGGARPRPASPPSATMLRHRFESWESDGVRVVPIRTVRELRAEGYRMQSCVGTYREQIERGDMVVFSAQVDGTALTISIAPWLGGWRISEWKGFANRSLTGAEIGALRPWREAHGIVLRSSA